MEKLTRCLQDTRPGLVPGFVESESCSSESDIEERVWGWIEDGVGNPRMGSQSGDRFEQRGETFAVGVGGEAKRLRVSAYR
jgi:hypothetical protein